MANNFISNSPQKTLSGRLNNIIKFSTELRWLVGFFYFSGWREVYDSLKGNPEIKLRLLVGLQVGNHLENIFEHDIQELDLSRDEYFNDFLRSLGIAINNKKQDNKEFYEQVHFFLEMLEKERLIIRKSERPNHAKLYLFEMNEEEREKHDFDGYLITGSSNLTQAGLRNQEEFNVEIKDYGYREAVNYFEKLWEKAIPITEIDPQKKRLIEFITHRSQAAEVKPFEAYAFVLKTFLDLQNQKKLKPQVEKLLEKNGFQKFKYQIQAVNQALSIIEENNGVIIADVVGLGKSVIASLIARNMDTKGIIICPPGLKGNALDKTGWEGYVENFDLKGWRVYSRGKIEDLKEKLDDDIETIIIDEAHSFRNQDTAAYEGLAQICKGKQVILLTATPFNNSPADIFSLLKLFIVPGLSNITLEDNLDGLFRRFNYQFNKLSFILKNYNSSNPKNKEKAENYYLSEVAEKLPVQPRLVREKSKELADTIKSVIEPVVIRRNRIDLKKDYEYKKEIGNLSIVDPPKELFYYLTDSQSKFYNEIVRDYFSEDGAFTGAIYQPAYYEKIVEDEEERDLEGNRIFQRQRNLYDFMRRLLVKRFESSFGAFNKTIERFISVHEIVLKFIEKTKGKYILDRDLIEKIYEKDEEYILKKLDDFEKELLNKKTPKDTTVYNVNNFERKEEFLRNIEKDLSLFRKLRERIKEENLVKQDPKRKGICETVIQSLADDPKRKIILFTEYVDTVNHLAPFFKKHLGDKVLICDGKVSKTLAEQLEHNFNAQYNGKELDEFQVLITSDKLSEGFNLNRAGTIINYDIPWNPTRVIQRVGRINRIGTKVFDHLKIFNFFPSEIGAEFVKSREIAEQKMFMIHNALGEDAQIFSEDEEPTESGLYKKINANPEDTEEINLITYIRNLYNEIQEKHPSVIENIEKLPNRVKTAKKFDDYNVNVLRKKGLSLFAQQGIDTNEEEIQSLTFNKFLDYVKCKPDTKRLPLSEDFWQVYEKIKIHKEKIRTGKNELSIEKKAHDNLKVSLKVIDVNDEENIEYIETLLKDIKKYHTMPKYTLRRLAFKQLSQTSSKKDWKQFFKELNYIKNRFGKDYLDQMLERIKNKNDEVIIAIENRK